MSRFKEIIKKIRVIILLVFLLFAVVAINPNPWQEGVAIRGVLKNSSAYLAGIESPSPTSPPRSREVIQSINNIPINPTITPTIPITFKSFGDFFENLSMNFKPNFVL